MRSITTLWFWRKGEDSPELLEAWDDFAVEENYEGWERAIQKALASVEGDISELGHRIIRIRVSSSSIEDLFHPAEIEGRVG